MPSSGTGTGTFSSPMWYWVVGVRLGLRVGQFRPILGLGVPKRYNPKLGTNTSQFDNWAKSCKQLQNWVSANMGFNIVFPGGAPMKRTKIISSYSHENWGSCWDSTH